MLWSLDLPGIILKTDCDDLSWNSESAVLGFLSLIKTQLIKPDCRGVVIVHPYAVGGSEKT